MAKSRPRRRRLKTELDPEQLRVWLAYTRVNLQLTYEMNHQLLAESELSLSDYHVLSKLHQRLINGSESLPLRARSVGNAAEPPTKCAG